MRHEPQAISNRPTIAVIDDDAAVRNSLAFAFQNEGFAIQIYGSAEDLLRDPTRIGVDCFVIDYKLPGLSGLELLAELRRTHVTAPAVLITTAPSAEVRRKVAAEGATIVEKPLLGEMLFQRVRTALMSGGAL